MKPLPKLLRNLSAAALASLTLGGCYYGDVYGSSSFASHDCAARYGDEYWSNDPYTYDNATYGYDCYDAADYHAGFAQIGFGGGWHQNLYYPGYGLFLFDRYGRRHSMSHDYLTYWGGRRAWHKHHGRHGRNGGEHGRGDGRRPGQHQPGYGYRGSDDSDAPHRHPRRNGSGRWTPPTTVGAAPVTANRPVPRTNIPPRSSGSAGTAPPPRSAVPVRAAPASPPPRVTPPPVQQRGYSDAQIREN